MLGHSGTCHNKSGPEPHVNCTFQLVMIIISIEVAQCGACMHESMSGSHGSLLLRQVSVTVWLSNRHLAFKFDSGRVHLEVNVLRLNTTHVHMLLFGTVVYKFGEL